jgi:hypothetical protein
MVKHLRTPVTFQVLLVYYQNIRLLAQQRGAKEEPVKGIVKRVALIVTIKYVCFEPTTHIIFILNKLFKIKF